MNRTRRRHRTRHRRHCAVATATLAMTLGLFAAAGAQGQVTGAPGRAAPGAGTPTAPKPPAGPSGAPGSTGNRPSPSAPSSPTNNRPSPSAPGSSAGNRPSPSASSSSAASSAATAAATTTTPTVVPAVPAPATPPTAAYADPDKNRPAIDNFVNLNLQNLLNDSNADAQSKARDILVAASVQNGAPASPSFLFQYGQSLNSAFMARLSDKNNKPTLHQRLNIAIVTARFAEQANTISTAVQQTTTALLQDPAEPVVLWGLRAARWQVPQVLQQPAMGNRPPQLITAIRDAAFKNPSGPIFDEAYNALSGNTKVIFDELTELWQNRLVQYQTKVPQDPSADGKPAFKLTTKEMWTAVVGNNAALKTQVIQMVSDQLSAAAQWADLGGQEDTHAQLVALARLCVQGLSVVGTFEKVPTLTTEAMAALGKLNPKSFPTGAKVMPVVDPVIQQVLANFKNVKPAPQVGPGAPGNPGAANGGVAGQ